MAIWLIKAGANGRYEQKFLQDNRIYITFPGLSINPSILPDRDSLSQAVSRSYAAESIRLLNSLVNQVWPFAHEVKKGDMVLMVREQQKAIAVGEVTGEYRFEHAAADPFYHWRAVNWLKKSVPRSHFGSDLLLTLSSRLMFCLIRNNNAQKRLETMRDHGWGPEPAPVFDEASNELIEGYDIETVARDQITRLITMRFTTGGLTELLEAVLKARGYTTSKNCADRDEGVILAGQGMLGFGAPRICAQVIMTEKTVGRSEVDGLLNAAEKFGAQEALLLSWNGFEPVIQEEVKRLFFHLRLWSKEEFLEELFSCYGLLDDDLKARLQLKPVWITTLQEP